MQVNAIPHDNDPNPDMPTRVITLNLEANSFLDEKYLARLVNVFVAGGQVEVTLADSDDSFVFAIKGSGTTS